MSKERGSPTNDYTEKKRARGLLLEGEKGEGRACGGEKKLGTAALFKKKKGRKVSILSRTKGLGFDVSAKKEEGGSGGERNSGDDVFQDWAGRGR